MNSLKFFVFAVAEIFIIDDYKFDIMFRKHFLTSFVIYFSLLSTRDATDRIFFVEKFNFFTVLALMIFNNKIQVFIVGIYRQATRLISITF